MTRPIKRIVIVGGGSAGWLTAGVIAATYTSGESEEGLRVTLIESPDISTIGVGEGTWPSMRKTLARIGISETDFLTRCDASFKQGTEFFDWQPGDGTAYTHPFSPPQGFDQFNPASTFLALPEQPRFDQTVCAQTTLFEQQQAPKQLTAPEYVGASNYGYHLDAGKFAELLQEHCVTHLQVEHVTANVCAITSASNGDIAALETDRTEPIEGDLFIDCSGTRGLLINEHYQIDFKPLDHFLFNNRAVATQVPYLDEHDPIASCTLATAQDAGWIWDIGLTSRRGVGYVFSSQHQSNDQAIDKLYQYIEKSLPTEAARRLTTRVIDFAPGHRRTFWHQNCVALGMAAGFIEPLEASALVLVELGAAMIADELPPDRLAMDRVSRRYNDRFSYRWARIIDFLKLHYILSKRPEPYWRDHSCEGSIPQTLVEQLDTWNYRSPWHNDQFHADEMFPSASYQYVLYGMGFRPNQTERPTRERDQQDKLGVQFFYKAAQEGKRLRQAMPSNRDLLTKIKAHGLKRI